MTNDNAAKTAIVFPGQGAQFPGMGRDLYESSAAAREIFERAESLRKGTVEQCFNASREELAMTENTQPCIFTVSLAFAAKLKEGGGEAAAVAGFSAGELAALTYAGVFSFEEGFKAACARAWLMQECASESKGSMAAVLRLPVEAVLRLCDECGVFAVNFNCPGQTAVSGGQKEMAEFCARVAGGGGRALPLAVSGAFHSPFMAKASEKFAAYLETPAVSPPAVPVYANLTAEPYKENASDIKKTLALQIQRPVLWQQTVENMMRDGINSFTEAEPGKVLTGLIAKIKEYR